MQNESDAYPIKGFFTYPPLAPKHFEAFFQLKEKVQNLLCVILQ